MAKCPACGGENKHQAKYCNSCGTLLAMAAQNTGPFILDRRYEILNVISEGGMGRVFKALDQRLDEIVAVKMMFADTSDKDTFAKAQEMFRREARLLTKLSHPGLPKVTDFFTENDQTGKTANYLVMTFIDGMDLETFLDKIQKPPIPLDDAILIFRRILEILKYLHSQNPPVIYRDLKPANIILKDDRLFLVDFGIAKFLEKGKPGTMMGTAGYASPDQCKGHDNLTNDIYSLGVLMHYLLTGLDPQDPSRPVFVFEPVGKYNRSVPGYIGKLIASMLEIVSSNRISSVEKVLEVLNRGSGSVRHLNQIQVSPAVISASVSGISGVAAGAQISSSVAKGRHSAAAVMTPDDFFEYAQNGDAKSVKRGLDEGIDVNGTDDYNWTALHLAAKEGRNLICELLVNYGANLKAATNKGWTPLHVAAFYGNTDTVETLLKKGANVNLTDNNGWIPLHMASRKGHSTVVDLLAGKGADINRRENNGWTPLHLAAYNGQTYTAEILIKKGADNQARDNDGWTPVYFAVQEGKIDTVELLIRYGADLSNSDNNGWTPLHIAAWKGQTAVAGLLVKNGAPIHARHTANFGKTPLRLAFEHGRTETVKLLRILGARE